MRAARQQKHRGSKRLNDDEHARMRCQEWSEGQASAPSYQHNFIDADRAPSEVSKQVSQCRYQKRCPQRIWYQI